MIWLYERAPTCQTKPKPKKKKQFLGKPALTCLLTQLCPTPCTVARQAPLSMGFPGQEYWSGLPFLPPCREAHCHFKMSRSGLLIFYFSFFLLFLFFKKLLYLGLDWVCRVPLESQSRDSWYCGQITIQKDPLASLPFYISSATYGYYQLECILRFKSQNRREESIFNVLHYLNFDLKCEIKI